MQAADTVILLFWNLLLEEVGSNYWGPNYEEQHTRILSLRHLYKTYFFHRARMSLYHGCQWNECFAAQERTRRGSRHYTSNGVLALKTRPKLGEQGEWKSLLRLRLKPRASRYRPEHHQPQTPREDWFPASAEDDLMARRKVTPGLWTHPDRAR